MKPRIILDLLRIVAFAALTGTDPTRLRAAAESNAPPASTVIINRERFAVLSDLHFNPFLSPAPVWSNLLSDNIPETNWPKILHQFEAGKVSPSDGFGRDASFCLIRSALTNLQANYTNLAFVLCTGDFLAHRYELEAGFESNHLSNRQQSRLIRQSEACIAQLLIQELTNKTMPIFPVLGNNDADGDYSEPETNLLQVLSNNWANRLGPNRFSDEFLDCGCYEASLPGISGGRILAFNSTVFSPSDTNKIVDNNRAERTLRWLGRKFESATETNTILAYHIPPGNNYFNSVNKSGQVTNNIGFWITNYQTRFLQLLATNHVNIIGSFCGHLHRDGFRLVYSDATAIGLIHLAPSISPSFGNNPAYQVFTTTTNGTIIDYTTCFLSNFGSLSDKNWDATNLPLWIEEYSFRKSFTSDGYNAKTLDALFEEPGPLRNQHRANFVKYYDVQSGADTSRITNPNDFFWSTTRLTNQ